MGYYYYIILGVSLTTSFSAFFLGAKWNAYQGYLKYIFVLTLISSIADAINYFALWYYKITAQYFYQLHISFFYRLIEFLLLFEFFKWLVGINRRLVISIQVVAALYFLWCYPEVPYTGLQMIDSTPLRILNCLTFIFMSILALVHYLRKMEIENPIDDPLFFTISSVLMYFSGITFIAAFDWYLQEFDRNASYVSWSFQNLFVILRNVLFGIAFYKQSKQPNGIRV